MVKIQLNYCTQQTSVPNLSHTVTVRRKAHQAGAHLILRLAPPPTHALPAEPTSSPSPAYSLTAATHPREDGVAVVVHDLRAAAARRRAVRLYCRSSASDRLSADS